MIRFLRTEVPLPGRFIAAAAALCLVALTSTATGATGISSKRPLKPIFRSPVAFDVSDSLRNLKLRPSARIPQLYLAPEGEVEIRPEGGPHAGADRGYSPDGALQSAVPHRRSLAIPSPLTTFEGMSNEDNFTVYGGRVNPPDPVGDVGPNHYVEMVNLVLGIYDKATGARLVGPFPIGALWAGFPITDCDDTSGDPVVLYDQLEDRWLLSQFTTNGPKYWNCVAISVTGDPTGAYYRYAFVTEDDPELLGGTFFPDYPKYSNWKKSYVLTTRDFGFLTGYGISVYALEKSKMIAGDPNARAVQFFIDGNNPALLPLVGDGLLPADIDGTKQPKDDAAIPIVGTQDDDASGVYGGTFDALNVWDLRIKWNSTPQASLVLAAQLRTAPFDSIYPCNDPTVVGDDARDCLPQPGVTDPTRELDILSYRQRPTYRLAYRNFGTYESLVTNQSVQATDAPQAGVRWYEIRRNSSGAYSIYQQGTYAPNDGVHRWMGSAAQDKNGNIALGYSVVNGVDVKPGVRYTARLAGDPLGQMTQGEGVIINGTGVQMTNNSRWGDYTSMNIDPTDDCTFWYVNEYYQVDGVIGVNTVPWQTRIGSFKLPGCN